MKNEQGITFDIPVSFWPQWANYATISLNGEIKFFSDKPTYSKEKKAFLVSSGKRCVWGNTIPTKTSPEKLLWKR